MKHALNQTKKSLTRLIGLTFLLTPVVSLWGAVFFGLINWNDINHVFLTGLTPAWLTAMLGATVLYFWHFFDPLLHALEQEKDSRHLATLLHRRVQRFNLSYWGLFIFYSFSMPAIFLYSLQLSATYNIDWSETFIWNFVALQFTLSILIGMPAYLIATEKLSHLSCFTGLLRPQNSVHSRLLLLAGFLPIMAYALLLQYHWLQTGHMKPSTLLIWGILAAITIFITTLVSRSLRRSLRPVEQALQSSGAVSHQSLANLKANSIDEVGFLTQTLGKVFQRLTDQETHIHAIIDNAAEGIIVTDEQGMIDTFNVAAQNLFGYESQEVRGKPMSWLVHDMLDNDGSPLHLSGRYKVMAIHRDGSELSVSVCISGVILSGKPVFIYLVTDVSEMEAALEKIQSAEALYRDLVETAHDLVWSMDAHGCWSYLNAAAINLYGYRAEEMIGRPLDDFRHPAYAEQEQQAFETIRKHHDLYQFETVHLDRHGKEIHLSFNARAQVDDLGRTVRITGTARDITATHEYQRQLSYQAEHDALTGLYNRRFFQQELDRVIARVARSSETCGLLYVDLDQFKYINDTLGHAAGDRLLVELTQLLSSNTREGDLLARFGGDEFTVLLYDIEVQNLQIVAENFRKLFDDYHFHDEGNGFNISISIGATLLDNNTRSSEEAMSHADIACNLAKTHGRNCVMVYQADQQDEKGMAEDMGWAARVRDMIDNDRFILAYQPIMATHSKTVQDYELLLRMPTDDGQIILPGGFMPAAERFGLIHNLDQWMVKQAIKRLSQMHTQGIYAHFCINLSDRAIEDRTLIDLIKSCLDETGIQAHFITFEISETAIITNLSSANDFFGQLKSLGCFCTLDDFGSGFSSLSYLKDLPVDKIKIDGSVINNIASNPVDRALVQSINHIAHVMGKLTIAECVEDDATLDILRELGVDFVQGHLLGRPIQELDHEQASQCVQQMMRV